MTKVGSFFENRDRCPFCANENGVVIDKVLYSETAEANKGLPDVEGILRCCEQCGIAYPSHVYKIEAFPMLYKKTFIDLRYFDNSFFQQMRKKVMKLIANAYSRGHSSLNLLEYLTLGVLQVPIINKKTQGLRILDVGCGFGEFLWIYKELGSSVVGTEIHPDLTNRLVNQGYDCRQGELEAVEFEDMKFDVIILRAVLYRTRNPEQTLETVKKMLAPNGQIALVDPSPGDGFGYFFRKQFPQGQFYILDEDKYFAMLKSRFGLVPVAKRKVYGRPTAPLKPIKILGNIIGLFELLYANLFKIKDYVLIYTLERARES